LLHLAKQDVIDYALKHKLSWHEDTTNHDERYTRNYIRHRLLGTVDADTRQQLLAIIGSLQSLNATLDADIAVALSEHTDADRLDASWLKTLPHDVACEIMASWLRSNQVADYDRPTIERLVVQAKTKPAGKRLAVRRGVYMHVEPRTLALMRSER
jgi:tRNA(Ile)-lysidine synthase TilS/MesJ